MKKHKIYFVLTFTGTFLSRLIRLYTKEDYAHVSISLDKNLKEMYSFGRLHAYNPFYGGLVHEKVNKGIYKRFSKTKTAIYSLEITEEQYRNIKDLISKMLSNKDIYRFNLLGLFACAINKRIVRNNYFYCAEFVKYIVENAKLDVDLPDVIKPMDFKKIRNIELFYKGLLNNYK